MSVATFPAMQANSSFIMCADYETDDAYLKYLDNLKFSIKLFSNSSSEKGLINFF